MDLAQRVKSSVRALALGSLAPWVALSASSADDLFRSTIQPALKQQCLGCHGEGNTFAKLDLSTREGALRGGQRGPAVLAGDPASSLLMAAIDHKGELTMPPGGAEKQLPETVRNAFREWIELGAPYVESRSTARWDFNEEDLWAFRPLRAAPVPSEGFDPGLVRTPVDAFILSALGERGLEPAPRAARETLIRRVTFDLTGLPPTPAEVDAFVSDDGESAYKDLVERLLDSPRYGERWGRHWLDVTRYADTAGYSNDFERPNAWRYRDYVIRSFNEDKPFDRFVLEQIAGDELFPDDPEAIIATGFLRSGDRKSVV